jgi:ParB family chromosome partitioning protein
LIAKVKNVGVREELLEQAIAQGLSLSQIRERLRLLESQESDNSTPTVQKTLSETYEKLKKAQLWKKDPKKWRKAQTLLKKLEQLLESDSDETADS